jgi:hypothetical protein
LLAGNILLLSWRAFTSGLESSYLRATLMGVLWLTPMFLRLNMGRRLIRGLGWSFTAHNVLILVGAIGIALRPDLNDQNSDLASFLGFSSDSGEEASFILVTAPAAVICLISMWYFLFIEKRGLLSPLVTMPLVLVGASAHRIDYLALAVLLFVYFWSSAHRRVQSRHAAFTTVLVLGYCGAMILLLRLVGLEVITDLVVPYFQRATSLFAGTQQLTVGERVEQYGYFFQTYLHVHEPARYLIGEGYLPANLKDDFYQYVQPHNFAIFTFVNSGLIGLILYASIISAIVVRYFRSRASLPFLMLMTTQLTDAAFTHFPIAAYVGLMLALMQAGWELSNYRLSESPPISPVVPVKLS